MALTASCFLVRRERGILVRARDPKDTLPSRRVSSEACIHACILISQSPKLDYSQSNNGLIVFLDTGNECLKQSACGNLRIINYVKSREHYHVHKAIKEVVGAYYGLDTVLGSGLWTLDSGFWFLNRPPKNSMSRAGSSPAFIICRSRVKTLPTMVYDLIFCCYEVNLAIRVLPSLSSP